MPSTYHAQKHLFPYGSGRGCYFFQCPENSSYLYLVMLEGRYDLNPWKGGDRGHPRDPVIVLLSLAYLRCQEHIMPQHWYLSYSYHHLHTSIPQDPDPHYGLSSALCFKIKLHHTFCHRIIGNWDTIYFTHSSEVV